MSLEMTGFHFIPPSADGGILREGFFDKLRRWPKPSAFWIDKETFGSAPVLGLHQAHAAVLLPQLGLFDLAGGVAGHVAKMIFRGRLYRGRSVQNWLISLSVQVMPSFTWMMAAAISPRRLSGRPMTATSWILG